VKSDKYTGNELKYLKMVLDGHPAEHGTWCKTLEKKFSDFFECKYAIAMNSGTATLHAALEALGVGAGDEVITPALTVIMDTSTIIQCNAIPVYADVDPETFVIDPEDIERKITPSTKAIIVVTLYGAVCDMGRINEISEKYNIPVIEDHAQCLLSQHKGNRVGVSNSFSSWSFENAKQMSCGEGGILLTNDENLAMSARKVAGHGYKNLSADGGKIKFSNQYDFQDPDFERHDSLGWNYRLSEFSAAIALAQFEDLEKKIEMRKSVANLFLQAIGECDYLTPQKVLYNSVHSYYTLGVRYDGDTHMGVIWQEFRDKYVELGGDGYYAAWKNPYLEPLMYNREYVKRYPEIYSNVSYQKGICPVAEELQPRLMQIKTNYRNLGIAKNKAAALRKTIEYFNNRRD